jgi:2-dehydropantoate 2-reductase
MRFAVIGVGGAGGYFGARLVTAGHDVAFIARGEHLAAIRRSGLRVDSVHGDVVARPSVATDDPREIGPVDCVIMGVKAWQVPEAARTIAPLVGPATAVIPLQNGVEASAQIADALGREHALGGTARIISFCVGPGHIKHVAAEPTIELGELDGTRSARVDALYQALQQSQGITATIPPDIRVALWAKFLLIAPVGGVGAVTRAPIGVIRGMSGTRQLLESAMEEIERVARAHEISLPQAVVASTMAYVDGLPAQGTSSLQRDLAEGKPSELESLNGAVARLGREVGVPTPTNAFLYQSLLPLDRRARGDLEF